MGERAPLRSLGPVVAIASNRDLVVMAHKPAGGSFVDVYGLERVHDNLLTFQYTVAGGHRSFSFHDGIACAGLALWGDLLYIADGSESLHVVDMKTKVYGGAVVSRELEDVRSAAVTCEKNMLAVLWRWGAAAYIEVWQCSREWSAPPLRRIYDQLIVRYLRLSSDGTLLATVDQRNVMTVLSTETGAVSQQWMLPFRAYGLVHDEEEGWMVLALNGKVHRADDQAVLVGPYKPSRDIVDLVSVIPGFGLIKVEADGDDFICDFLRFVARPDVAARAAMTHHRVQWMVAVVRRALQ